VRELAASAWLSEGETQVEDKDMRGKRDLFDELLEGFDALAWGIEEALTRSLLIILDNFRG
jgi:hypothetical protein